MENAVSWKFPIKLIMNQAKLGVIYMDNYGLFKRKHSSRIRTNQERIFYDLKSHHGEVEDCIIFGISSITGKVSSVSR